MSHFEQIPSERLTLEDIPTAENQSLVNRFALTFDAYAYWGSFGACAHIANNRLSSTLAELRTCLFFEQRRSRFVDTAYDEKYMSELLLGIRQKIMKKQNREPLPDMDEKLKRFYESVVPDLLEALPLDKNISNPLLLSIRDEYKSAKKRLLIVGQETHGWYNDVTLRQEANLVECMQAKYREFDLARNWSRKKTSVFWVAAHQIQVALAPDVPGFGFMWSNLFCCDENKTTPSGPVGDILRENNLLTSEIAILKPDAVNFLTGPVYDYTIDALFSGSTYHSLHSDIPIRKLARIQHSDLPPLTFRTYHPSYLKRSKQWHVLSEITEKIKETWLQKVSI